MKTPNPTATMTSNSPYAGHTPGPWIVNGNTVEALALPDESQTYVAPICEIDVDWNPKIATANARLIAAAPMLVQEVESLQATNAALRAALEAAVARVELANSEGNPILSAWLPDARAALAGQGVQS
jgi:hypothetical protein